MEQDTKRNIVIHFLLACFLTLITSAKAAESSWPKTDRDFSVLPKYCLYKLNKKQYPAEYDKWKRFFGHKGWTHIHHYCYGLHALQKYRFSFDHKEKKRWLETALYQWEYVDKRWPRDFRLRPELYLKWGETLLEAGNSSAAIAQFKKAIATKPDYSLPYVALADYFSKRGNREEALKWVQAGLKHAPSSRKLKQRLESLKE